MKKNLKRLMLLMFLCVLIFVIYSNKKTNGTYIGLHMHSNNDSLQWNIEEVLVIGKQQIQRIVSSYTYESKPERYFTIGNTIFTKAQDDYQLFNQLKITHFDKDSLVLKNYSVTKTFKELPDSLKTNKTSTIDLKNMQFEVNFEGGIIDTLYFEKDFYIRKSNQPDRKWETAYWEVKEVNGFYFLFTGDSFLFLIQRKNEKLYLFKLLKDRINEIELNEINVKSSEINSIIKNVEKMRKNNVW